MIEVRPDAVSANVASMRTLLGRDVMGIAKANGYGHGAVLAARAMVEGGATWLGVVDLAEALSLRHAGMSVPILTWLHASDADFAVAAQHGIDVGVSNLEQLEAAAAAGATVHLKVDSGLGRNGVPFGQWRAFVARAAELCGEGLVVRGLFSHIAGSGRERDLAQVAVFTEAVEIAEELGATVRHLGASAASLEIAESRFDLARIGIASYGIHPEANAPGAPADGSAAASLGLQPAMTVRARASQGVVPLGYGIGLLHAPGAPVVVDGVRHRVVAMDASTITLDAPVSGEAVLFGDPADGSPSVDEWASAAQTIGYEVTTRLSARAPRSTV